ncbi:hypothetical protein [Streptomyces sp. NPDC101206]|uniref:hypothetical protein n=1 Tax=Streptomyces sp. NPDC101206 TaxID=3366128 RepID=UPI00380E973B
MDGGRVLSAAGVAAGVDLCLHLLRRDHGSVVANRVARLCVVPPWREGGQATDLPVDRIAEEAGPGTGASLRRHTAPAIGVAPLAYRQAFRAKASAGAGS